MTEALSEAKAPYSEQMQISQYLKEKRSKLPFLPLKHRSYLAHTLEQDLLVTSGVLLSKPECCSPK
jgi:hypothetical protein